MRGRRILRCGGGGGVQPRWWPSRSSARAEPGRSARPSRRPRSSTSRTSLAPPESSAVGVQVDVRGADQALGRQPQRRLSRRHAPHQGARDHGRREVRQRRHRQPGRRRLHGVPRDVRLPHAVPRARLPARLRHVQRRDRQEPRRDLPEEVQAQGPLLLRLRLPSLLEQPPAHQPRPPISRGSRCACSRGASSPTPSTASARARCRCPGARSSRPPSKASSTAPTCPWSTSTRSRPTRSRSTPR